MRYNVIYNPFYHDYGYWYNDPMGTRQWYSMNDNDLTQPTVNDTTIAPPTPLSPHAKKVILWTVVGGGVCTIGLGLWALKHFMVI